MFEFLTKENQNKLVKKYMCKEIFQMLIAQFAGKIAMLNNPHPDFSPDKTVNSTFMHILTGILAMRSVHNILLSLSASSCVCPEVIMTQATDMCSFRFLFFLFPICQILKHLHLI